MSDIKFLEQRIQAIEERNKNVQLDKAWEGSWARRLLIIVFTYLGLGLYMRLIGIKDAPIQAVIPTVGFTLSTLSLPYFKKLWIRKQNR